MLLKKDRKLLKKLVENFYNSNYTRVKKDGTIILKDKWYSLSKTIISLNRFINTIIPKSLASVAIDSNLAFNTYKNVIRGFNNDILCIEYFYNESLVLPTRGILLERKSFALEGLILTHKKIITFIPKIKTKKLDIGIRSQLILPFPDQIEEENEVIGIINTGDPEWDKKLKLKYIRPRKFNFI